LQGTLRAFWALRAFPVQAVRGVFFDLAAALQMAHRSVLATVPLAPVVPVPARAVLP
jgi:hypothetical protein